jgi:processive 1,2-diacylglycerol beta-glucosyltransferase
MKRILILTAGYGEGHNAAARALAAALTAEGAEPVVRDLFLETYGSTQELSQRLYVECINRAPLLWWLCYNALDRLPLMRWCIEPSTFLLRRHLARVLAEVKPEAVVSVYPSYGYALDRLFPTAQAPFQRHTVVTDSITVNSIWHRCRSDSWIVPNEATAQVMCQAGVPATKVHALGFPVPLIFSERRPARPNPRESEPLRVLYMVNHSPQEAPTLVRKILELPGVELIVAGGKDPAVLRAIEHAAPRPVELHGWTNRMPELLMRSHVLIGKAGGAATQEAIAARTPMLVTKVVPGQEEGNALLLEQSGAGAVCLTHQAVIEKLSALQENGAALWHQWHEQISRLSKPDAARQIAKFVLEQRRTGEKPQASWAASAASSEPLS